jgi:hypothetical protein
VLFRSDDTTSYCKTIEIRKTVIIFLEANNEHHTVLHIDKEYELSVINCIGICLMSVVTMKELLTTLNEQLKDKLN